MTIQKSPNFQFPNIPTVPIWQSANLEVIFQLATLPIWQSRNLAIWQSGNLSMPKICENLPDLAGLVLGWVEAKFCNKIRNVQLLPKTTRSPSFCTAPRREIFETVGEEVDSFAEISANIDGNLQSCRGSFSAGSRPNFAAKYATCSIWPDLPALPAFAPPRVEKFSKRSAKKSTASPKFPKKIRNFLEIFLKILKIFENFPDQIDH